MGFFYYKKMTTEQKEKLIYELKKSLINEFREKIEHYNLSINSKELLIDVDVFDDIIIAFMVKEIYINTLHRVLGLNNDYIKSSNAIVEKIKNDFGL